MTPPAPISAERIEEIRRFDIAGEIERTDTILNRMRMSKQERTVLDILKHLVQMRADLLTALDAATARAEEAEDRLEGMVSVDEALEVSGTKHQAMRAMEKRATAAEAEVARLEDDLLAIGKTLTVGSDGGTPKDIYLHYGSEADQRAAVDAIFRAISRMVKNAALAPTTPAAAPQCPRTDRECLFPECGCNAPAPLAAPSEEMAREFCLMLMSTPPGMTLSTPPEEITRLLHDRYAAAAEKLTALIDQRIVKFRR